MISLLRPGGTIILEDVDDISYTCVPLHPSWTILLDAFHATIHANGGNAFIGRELAGYLREAGIKNAPPYVPQTATDGEPVAIFGAAY